MTGQSPETRQRSAAKPAASDARTQKTLARASKAPPAAPQLTAREADIVELATMGLTNSQIAQRLSLSTYAIKFHLSSAYSKLGVANRTQAAVAYLDLRRAGRL